MNQDSGNGYKWVGSRPVRPDGVDKVTGRARFAADHSLPGMLVGAILRSPHAHARIRSIDTSRAESLPGVKAVITSADLPDHPSVYVGPERVQLNFAHMTRNVMAREKALYEGHSVAAVAATTKAVAEEALSLIDVDYEVLPHVIDVKEAMRPGAPLLHPDLYTRGVDPAPDRPSNISKRAEFGIGDVEAGFREADETVEMEFTTRPVHQGYIEPHACVARFGEDGQAEVWGSSQGHFQIRAFTSRLLGLALSDLRVTPAEIGGGFGGKTVVYLEPLALALARKSGAARQARDEPGRGLQGHRPDLRGRDDGEDRGDPGRTHHRRRRLLPVPGGSVSGLPGAECVHVRVRPVRPRERAHGGLRRGVQPAEVRRLPRPRLADLRLRGRERHGRARPQARHRPARPPPAQRGPGRHAGRLRTEIRVHRLRRHDRSPAEPSPLPHRPRTEPGPRGRLRLLVQQRRRIERDDPPRGGRYGGRRDGEPGHRGFAGVDGDHGRGDPRHRLRPRAAHRRRHRVDRLHRRHGRQPGHPSPPVSR